MYSSSSTYDRESLIEQPRTTYSTEQNYPPRIHLPDMWKTYERVYLDECEIIPLLVACSAGQNINMFVDNGFCLNTTVILQFGRIYEGFHVMISLFYNLIELIKLTYFFNAIVRQLQFLVMGCSLWTVIKNWTAYLIQNECKQDIYPFLYFVMTQ